MSDNQISHSENNKRIAKNTVVLYLRMILMMLVTLYTSRVVLEQLGVEDYGIYNVVGGFVAMSGILTQSFSAAITRFLTFELGRNDYGRLRAVFATSICIQIILSVVIVLFAETLGVWFLNAKMSIPLERLSAANWVLQFSVVAFVISLFSVPYNALVTAHEKMSAFAYISLVECGFKLLIAFLISISPIDKLVFYAALLVVASIIIRSIYTVYCHRNFEESRGRLFFDREVFRQMFGFSGWNAIGAGSFVLRTNGVDVVLNLFFGPVVNSARGVSNQVTHAVTGFVNNFMVAVNPQITKSYASGDHVYLNSLVFKSCRLSFFLILFLSSPIILNTGYILDLWLVDVPLHTVLFVRLSFVLCMVDALSTPLVTLQLATGNIRNYQLVVGGLQMLNLPVAYLALWLGCRPESVVVVAIVISLACMAARLVMLRRMVGFPVRSFVLEVVFKVVCVAAVVAVALYCMSFYEYSSLLAFVVISAVSMLMAGFAIWFVGLGRAEKEYVFNAAGNFLGRWKKE